MESFEPKKGSCRRTAELLESFAVHYLCIGAAARRLERLDELPPELRRNVGNGRDQQYSWFAWEHDGRVSLITGESVVGASQADQPTLRLCRFTPQGELISCGLWHRLGHADWQHGPGREQDCACRNLALGGRSDIASVTQ